MREVLFLTEARGRQAREALLKANARIEEESVARVAAQEQVKMLLPPPPPPPPPEDAGVPSGRS